MTDYIDPNWTMQNDRQSVTVGINTRLWILRQQKMLPSLIRLGKDHTRLFWKEHGFWYIPKGPARVLSGLVTWDPERNCWCYSRQMIPIRFNDTAIHGIAVEGVPKLPKPRAKVSRTSK